MNESMKIIIIGNSSVGKSSILNRFANDEFYSDTQSTIGVEIMRRTVEIDHFQIQAQIWDTAGQEKYRAISKIYYRGVKGALLCYDITSRNSFVDASKWLKELKESCDEEIVVLLVGNKLDLKNARQVSTEEAKNFAKDNHLSFIETSAKNSSNIDVAFKLLVEEIFKKEKIKHQFLIKSAHNAEEEPAPKETQPLILDKNVPVQQKKGNCCY